MTRPAPTRLLACLLAVVGALVGSLVLAASPGAAEERASTRTPLRVSIETLAPATIPQHGRLTISGTITNRSHHTWNNLKAYLLISQTPLRSREELAEAAASDPAAEVGGRLAGQGLYQVVGDLAPGAAVGYQLSIRRQDLGISGESGVYWVGVHVLGEDSAGRDNVADGRARTFMPLLTPRATSSGAGTRLALVVPVKGVSHRGAAGRLLSLESWQRALGPDGRLDRLLRLSARAQHPITWVVDPAVLDAAESVARDNPKLDTGPCDGGSSMNGSGSSDGSSDGSSESPSSSPSPGSGDQSDQGDVGSAAEPTAQAQAAQAWLDEFRRQAPTHTVESVPYGDLDVASALSSRLRSLYAEGVTLSRQTLAAYGVDNAAPAVDPVHGVLPASALRRVPLQTTVLLADSTYPDHQQPVVAPADRAPVVLTDTEAGSGGPRPNSRYAALSMRQRILSEAALHALSPDRTQPLVVSTPAYWNPGSAWSQSRFFAGLDQTWLQMVDLPTVVSDAPTDPSGGPSTGPVYPRADRAAQVPFANLLATRQLTETGIAFAELLTDNDTVDDALSRTAMLASAQGARAQPERSLHQVKSSIDYVRGQMSQVRVEGPPFVMMSSQQGPISVRLVNDLDQPVTVGIGADTRGGGLTVSKPDPVRLGPGERTAVRLEARSDGIGVHAVTVYATTADGTPVGAITQFNVRTSHVSTVIWVIMAIGAAVLFLAIVIRLIRRVRRRRRTHGPLLPPPDRPTRPSAPDPTDPSGPHERPQVDA